MENSNAFSDEALLLQVAESDQDAFDQLFARYRDRLFAYLFKLLKSREQAEESVLDVFMKIWKGRQTLDAVEHFEAFLFRIARNQALDFLRKTQRSRIAQKELWHRMQHQNLAPFADEDLRLEETAAAITAAIAQLSPQRRRVFLLSREHELSYEQIAAQLHLSTHTIRNHIAASLRLVRSHLQANETLILLILLAQELFVRY